MSQAQKNTTSTEVDKDEYISDSESGGRGNYSSNQAYLTYVFKEDLFQKLDRLIETGKFADGLIINMTQVGFSIPMETLYKFAFYAQRILRSQGVLIFVKADGAITLTKDDTSGGLTLNVYDSPFGIFARHPLLADYVCATVAGIDRRRLREGGSTLASHILYNSTPVLTEAGRGIKDDFSLPAPQNWVLQLVDDYSSVESIMRTLEKQSQIPQDEMLRTIQELEAQKFIFPIFPRIQFLSNCYHNRKRFRLGRYLVASGYLTEAQLQELLEQQEEEGWGRTQRTYLGLLAVRAGYINTRALDILLDDQFLYGGYGSEKNADGSKDTRSINIESVRDSMIGSLGAIDGAGVLQSLATAARTGVLTVENRHKVFSIAFSNGQPTHAKLNRLCGYNAATEFLVEWNEGIFVFKDKASDEDFTDECRLKYSLNKLLLDSALFQDQSKQILNKMPGGKNCVLERVWNFDALWHKIENESMKFGDNTPISKEDKTNIFNLVKLIDGLTTLDEVIRLFDHWPAYMVLRSVEVLFQRNLVIVQKSSLFRPLTIFQKITQELTPIFGPEKNKDLLDSSLHYVHGDSIATKRFHIDHEGRVSVNLSLVKQSGASASAVLLELRRWMEAYLAYCRREVDTTVIDTIVTRVIDSQKYTVD